MEGKADNAYTQALENKVSLVNSDDEWKASYMTMAMKLADERREGKREGKNIVQLISERYTGNLRKVPFGELFFFGLKQHPI